MFFRLLRTAIASIAVMAAVGVIMLALLWITNPRPSERGGWSTEATMPVAVGETASAMTRTGELFVIGGLRGAGTTSDEVFVYDGDWRKIAADIEPTHHAAAAFLDGRVWLSGGARTATDWTPADDLVSLSSGDSRSEPAMPEGRQGHAMVALGGKLYVVGGVGSTDDTLIYDPDEGAWTRGAPLIEGRDHLRAAAWGGKVWALGGRAGDVLSRVDVYDPERDTWAPGPQLPEPMSAMAVGVLPDGLHVVGGEDPNPVTGGVSRDHFVLREAGGRWRDASAPALAVHGGAFGVHDGRLVIAGGASRQGALSVLSWTGVTQVFDRP